MYAVKEYVDILEKLNQLKKNQIIANKFGQRIWI